MRGSQSNRWQLLVVCGVALLCRLAVWWWRGESLQFDVDAYLEIARHLAAGDGFAKDLPPHLTAYRPPLYPVLVAAVFKLGGSPFALGLIQAVLGTVTVGLTYRVGQLLQLGSASLIAAGLVAGDPLLLQYTALPMTEVLCTTLVILWCWIACEFLVVNSQHQQPYWGASLLHGGCLGLLCLCRPAFLAGGVLVIATIGIQVFRAWRSKVAGRAPLTTFSPVIWSTVGLMAMMAPWMIRNALVIGKATPATTHGGYTLLLANNPTFYREVVVQPWGTVWQRESLLRWQQDLERQLSDARIPSDDEVARDRWMYDQAISYIRNQPALFMRACVWRGLRFWDLAPWSAGYPRLLVWGTAVFYGAITAAILIALWHIRGQEWNQWGLLLLFPLTLWLTHLVYWTDMRMRAPVIPILALLAAKSCISRQRPAGLTSNEPSGIE